MQLSIIFYIILKYEGNLIIITKSWNLLKQKIKLLRNYFSMLVSLLANASDSFPYELQIFVFLSRKEVQ